MDAHGRTTRELISMTLDAGLRHRLCGTARSSCAFRCRGTIHPVPDFGGVVRDPIRVRPAQQSAAISLASVQMNLQPPWNTNNAPSLYMGKALNGSFMQVSYNYTRSANTVQFAAPRAMPASSFALRPTTTCPRSDGSLFRAQLRYCGVTYALDSVWHPLKSPCDCWAFDVGITNSYNPNEVSIPGPAHSGRAGIDRTEPLRAQSFRRDGAGRTSDGCTPDLLIGDAPRGARVLDKSRRNR